MLRMGGPMPVSIGRFRLPPTSTVGVFCGYEFRAPFLHGAERPPTMKAILCTHYGGPDELELADIPAPTAGPKRGRRAHQGRGAEFLRYPDHRRQIPVQAAIFPFSPASEFAGIVDSVGPGATGVAPGDRVLASSARAPRGKASRWRHSMVKLPDKVEEGEEQHRLRSGSKWRQHDLALLKVKFEPDEDSELSMLDVEHEWSLSQRQRILPLFPSIADRV